YFDQVDDRPRWWMQARRHTRMWVHGDLGRAVATSSRPSPPIGCSAMRASLISIFTSRDLAPLRAASIEHDPFTQWSSACEPPAGRAILRQGVVKWFATEMRSPAHRTESRSRELEGERAAR